MKEQEGKPEAHSALRDRVDWDKSVQQVLRPKAWEDFFFRTPCVKSSYLWGVGCGSLMLAHKMRLYRGNNFSHSFNAAFFTFIVTSAISFHLCATDRNMKHETIKKAFSKQGIKEEGREKS